MSDRRSYTDVMLELAAQLGKETRARFRPLPLIVDDVRRLAAAGTNARLALNNGVSPEQAYADAERVAETYLARVVRSGEVEDIALGLCFRDDFGATSQAVFRVA